MKFKAEEIKKMKDGILTHNHPNGSCFSSYDINMARRAKLAEIRVAIGEGSYVFRPNGSSWPKEISSRKAIEAKMAEMEDFVSSRCRDIAAREGLSGRQSLQLLDREGMAAFCQHYGFEFSWEDKRESEFFK